MEKTPLNLNSSRQVCFKGKITPDANDLKAVKRFANCAMNNLEKELLSSIGNKNANLISDIEGQKFIPDDNIGRKAISGLKSFFGMPLDILDFFIKKLPPDSKLNNSKLLQRYRNSIQLEDEIRALQGIHENGLKFVKETMPKGKEYPTGACDDFCESICSPVAKKFNSLLNSSMSSDKAVYDTKKERFWARIASGFTAAVFLGNDFYNKAIQKGKTKEEAIKEQHLKQGQEVTENICEAITQFAVFACFSKTVNKSIWAPAIIGAAIGLVSRIFSRITNKMPITRIKPPQQFRAAAPSFSEYAKAAKENSIENLPKEKLTKVPEEKESKKPILSAKNILLFCAFSILGGYSLRFLKGNTETGRKIAQKLKENKDKFNKDTIEEVFASNDKLKKLKNILEENQESNIGLSIKAILDENANNGKISLGTDFKTTKLFGLAEVKVKDLKALKTAPFRFIKELVSYPYKIASKLEEAIKNSRLRKKGIMPAKKADLLKDKYEIKNLYKRFLEFDAKYGEDDKKLAEEFGKYIKKMRMLSNNNVTSSKGNNSKIAVIAQTLGTLTGMWFNMNDEFNSSVRNGSTKSEAEKDARLRGINKFFRMTVQIIISGSLNDIFSKQYNSSIAKSAAVVAASTILTDMASRVLTGMPFKKMTKEELEKYQKDHKEGVMAGYYKLIDKLAS